MGSLSQVIDLPIGSAISELPQMQIASENVLIGTHAPRTPQWATGGPCGFGALTYLYQWDAGFLPAAVTSSNGLAGYMYQATNTIKGFVQCQTTQALYAISTSFSQACRLELRGLPSGHVCYVTFNPNNGRIISVSPTIAGVSTQPTNINISVLSVNVPITTTIASVQPIPVVQVSFYADDGNVGDTSAEFRFYPNANSGAADISAGGFQLEDQQFIATAFIGTPRTATFERGTGLIPRSVIDRSKPPAAITDDYTLEQGVDSDIILDVQTAGKTITLPLLITGTKGDAGQPVTICNNNAGNTTIVCPNTNGLKIYGAGLPATGVNTFTLPFVGTGTEYPNATIEIVFSTNNGIIPPRWLITGSNMGSLTTPQQVLSIAAAITAGALTLNQEAAGYFTVANNANITTFNITNPAPAGLLNAIQVELTANGTPYTQVYPSGTVWAGGVAPTLTTTNGKRDLLQFESRDGGTTWFGFVLGQNF